MRSAAYGAAPQDEGESQYAGNTTTLPQATTVGMPLAQPRVLQPPTRTLIASVGSVKQSEQKLQLSVRLAGSASLPAATTHALIGALLGTGTGAAQTIAVTATSAHSSTARHDVVLRPAASHPATLDTAFSVLTTLARSFGVEPERLDGRHAAGVAATLPLGVPLS